MMKHEAVEQMFQVQADLPAPPARDSDVPGLKTNPDTASTRGKADVRWVAPPPAWIRFMDSSRKQCV